MRRWTMLAVLLLLTVALVATGYAQTAGQSSTGSAQAKDPGKAPVVDKPMYPGMSPVRNPDGSQITNSHHNVVEKPTYDRTLLNLRSMGAKVHQVTLESDGLDVAGF